MRSCISVAKSLLTTVFSIIISSQDSQLKENQISYGFWKEGHGNVFDETDTVLVSHWLFPEYVHQSKIHQTPGNSIWTKPDSKLKLK